MTKHLVRQAAYHIAPGLASQIQEHLWQKDLEGQAKALRARCRGASLEAVVDEVLSHPEFGALQKRSEILQLLMLVKEVQPRYLCEIGAAGGGSLFLFCQVA